MELVYILHFAERFKHAQHYVGRSTDTTLGRRLRDHRNGQGANLTQWVVSVGTELELGAVWQVPGRSAKVERLLKRIRHAHRFCSRCSLNPKRLRGCTPIDIRLINFNEE